jgi:formiminoglutamase
MSQFSFFTKENIHPYINHRNGESRLGESIQVAGNAAWEETIKESTAKFVVLGIPEDIGVRANLGIGGSRTAWESFLKSFLNIQDTKSLRGTDFILLGAFECKDWLKALAEADIETLREYTTYLDDVTWPLIRTITAAGKIPIVIGGGHNNAYPILKGGSLALGQAMNAINLDAHSDFRVAEGRHSGNGFRYAHQEGFLKKYAILGLHEAYNSEVIVATLLQHPDLFPLFWEDIFLRGKISPEAALMSCLEFVSAQPFGVELDVDCIENVLSSAASPVGITPVYAMQYLYQCGLSPRSAYLHLPEGVALRDDGLSYPFIGKLLSYLVQAFAKGVMER